MSDVSIPASLATCPIMQKQWAAQLFAEDVATAHKKLYTELGAALGLRLSPYEFFCFSEVARVLVAGIHNRWLKVFDSNPSAFTEDVSLWELLWSFYSRSLRALHDGDPELSEAASVFLERALFIGRVLRLSHSVARQPFPSKYWLEMYAYFRFAEKLNCLDNNIPDKLSSLENRVNCHSTTMHALLLDLANVGRLSSQQILWINRWLPRLSRKVVDVKPEAPQTGLFLRFDLGQPEGGGLRAKIRPEGGLIRFSTLDQLSQTLDRRRRHLIAGQAPATLKLGDDISRDDAISLLVHLEAAWCPPDLPHADSAAASFEWDEKVD
jgi:hypothetical protein